jgi:histidinol-phosphate aminotransferase
MTLQRREMLRHSALAVAAFAFSRETFANEIATTHRRILLDGSEPSIIKLSSNENPHGPSPMARKAMADAVNGSNRYPWDVTTQLRERIAKEFSLTKEHVLIGAGSSELLGVVSTWAMLLKGNVVAPEPTFKLWMPAARKLGLTIKTVPLTVSKVTDLQRMKDSMDDATRMLYICNPNNPTGTVIPAADLEAFIKLVGPKSIILLDEAYTEFSDEPSMAKLVNDYPNLVVAKTFSKIYGMAGARVGFALAHPQSIKALSELQSWANAGASAVSLAGALASMDDARFLRFCKVENAKSKKVFYDALTKAGIPYIPSVTSFVYFNCENYKKDFRAQLEANKIIGARTFEDGTKWLRLSVGTVSEMTKVADTIKV